MSARRSGPADGGQPRTDGAESRFELLLRLGDISTASGRQERLLSIPDRGVRWVILDLTGVQSIEASTLGAILLLRQTLRESGGGLRLQGCSEAVSAVLRGLHLERILCLEET